MKNAQDRAVVATYDRLFRLSGVSGGTGVGATWTHDLANRRTNATLANAVTSLFYFDVDDRPTSIVHLKNGPLIGASYGYDAVGNRRYTQTVFEPNRSELYTHDARDRLRAFERGVLNAEGTAITTPLVDATLPTAQAWTDLDRRGNWLDSSLTLNGGTTEQTRTVNGANEYLTLDPDGPGQQPAVTLAYDANGNLTQDPTARNAGDGGTPSGQVYEYDEENRLTRIRRAADDEPLMEVDYDALWRRVESREYLDAASGQLLDPPRVTRHVSVGVEAAEDYAVTNGGQTVALAREFVWGRGFPEPVAMVDHTDAGDLPAAQAEVLHYLHDVLGSVVALTKATGIGSAILAERYRYDAYGKTYIYAANGTTLRPASAYGNPFAFTGQRYDTATRTYQFLYRSYSPWLGRWFQRDLAGYMDGVNLYEDVVSDPVDRTDPLGLSWWRRLCNWLFPPKGPSVPDVKKALEDEYRAASQAAEGITSVDDVIRNPQLLAGKTPDQVEPIIGKTPGWKVETLGKGAHKGQGWVLREYTPQGDPTGRTIRWHPGGGHHGPDPYWRVTGGDEGKSDIIDGKPRIRVIFHE